MRNKITKIFLIVGLLAVNVFGQIVIQKTVEISANNWCKTDAVFLKPNNIKGKSTPLNITVLKDEKSLPLAFVVNLKPKGFVVFSADERINPVLAYSFETDFNFKNPAENFALIFLKNDVELRLKLLDEGKANPEIVSNNRRKWQLLISGKSNFSQETKDVKTIYGPFLNSTWGQAYVNGEPVFNYYTPNNWPAGCVATAMAQIMNYYKWPLRGYGRHSYTDNNTGTHSANFGNTVYDWANTLDDYENVLFTTAQQQAAGLLTYHASVSVNMDFEYNGSTASTSDAPYALRHYFRYSGHYTSASTSGFWTALKNNMLDERPAILSIKRSDGMGHAAVVDGYAEMNGYYHLNPGWYGSNIGWYDISGSWNMGGYTIVVGAAKGIVPSPMINDINRIDSLDFYLSWSTSRHQKADYYELQQARSSSGPWTTLNSEIRDTVYRVHVNSIGSYYYRVRARRDNIWWDYSTVKKVALGSDREIVFRVNMNVRPLHEGETVGVRGNIEPLSGIESLGPFEDPDGDGIYEYTVKFNYDRVGETLIYRFTIDSAGVLKQIESQNREHTITTDVVQILPVVNFDNLSEAEEKVPLVKSFSLSQNYPNPFGEAVASGNSTTIKYSIPNDVGIPHMRDELSLHIAVYDVLGRKVATLVNARQTAGEYSVRFNASSLPSGIYFYKLSVGSKSLTKKMILIK